MRSLLPRRIPGSAAALGVATVLAAGALLVSGEREAAPETVPMLVGYRPVHLDRLVVESAGQRVDLTRRDARWSPQAGTPSASAVLLADLEDDLFPLRGYRAVAADPSDPQYGLVRPELVVHVQGRDHERTGVAFGEPSFSGAGFYAGRLGDHRQVFVVPRNTMDILRSLVAGDRVVSADPLGQRTGEYQADLEHAERSEDLTVYLRQALDAGRRMPPELERE